MKRDDTYTRIAFLCAGCLRSEETVVPTTSNIGDDLEKAEEHMLSYGWTVKMKGYDKLYYCARCSGKATVKQQGRFIQNTFGP